MNQSPQSPPPATPVAQRVFGRCPTTWLISQLADRWSIPILSSLYAGPKRFSQLRCELRPVSPRMLGRTLKRLQQLGFVERTVRQRPQQVHYELTDLGRSISQPLERLLGWSQRNVGVIEKRKADRGNKVGKNGPGL